MIAYAFQVSGTDANDDQYGAVLRSGNIVACDLMPNVAVTANDTNKMTFSVKIGSATLASRVTDVAGGNMVAGTNESLGDAVGARVNKGDVLHLDCDKGGTGPAYDCTLRIMVEEAL